MPDACPAFEPTCTNCNRTDAVAFGVTAAPYNDPYNTVMRMPLNTQGRDFVVGDLHGSVDLIHKAMKKVAFDENRDRLFLIGDLVDRGPKPVETVALLNLPFIHAIRGNQEQMFLEIYADGEPNEAALAFFTKRNGMAWWMKTSLKQRRKILAAFARLPLVIEIKANAGGVAQTIGLVHADVPTNMDWQSFLYAIENGDHHVRETAIWSRTRITHGIRAHVEGVDTVYVGHTIVERPTQLGNIRYIDTGAYAGLINDNANAGRLTIVELTASTDVFLNSRTNKLVSAHVVT